MISLEIDVFQHANNVVKKYIAYLTFLVILNIAVFIISGSYSILITGVYGIIYLIEAIMVSYIIKSILSGRVPKKETSKSLLFADILCVSILAALIFLSYMAMSSMKMVSEPLIAFSTTVITLIVTGIASIKLEESLLDDLPYLGRRLGDHLRMLLIASAFAAFGIIMNVLTIYWFEPAIAILIAIIIIREELYKINRTYKGIARPEERETILELTKREVLEVPAIKDISDAWFSIFGYFAYGALKFSISPIVPEDEYPEIKKFILKRLIRTNPNVIAVDLSLNRLDADTIRMVASVKDDNTISPFDETNKFLLLDVSYPEIEITKNDVVEIEVAEYKIIPAQKARELALKKVEVLLTKDISDLARNELEGWFIKTYITKSNIAEEAAKEFLNSIKT